MQESFMCNCYPSNHCGSAPYTMQPGAYSNAVDCTCFLGIATVPWQQFTKSYEPEQAFMVGTIFPELDKPFLGRSVRRL